MNIIQQTVEDSLKDEIIEYYYNSKTQYNQTTTQYMSQRLKKFGNCMLINISDLPFEQSVSTCEKVLYFQSKKEYVFICLVSHLFKQPPEHGQNIQSSLRTQQYKLYKQ